MTTESLLYTKHSRCEMKNEGNELVTERNCKGPILVVHNVLTFSRAEIRLSTAKLSAAIMNVPYKNFQDSIKNKCNEDPILNSFSTDPAAVTKNINLNVDIDKNKLERYPTQEVDIRNKHNQDSTFSNENENEKSNNVNLRWHGAHATVPLQRDIFKKKVNSSSGSPPENTKLSKYDILRRIQEAYNACSCKVCECIASISQPVQNDDCKCKPCECSDCLSFKTRLRQLENKQTLNDNYYMRCNLKSGKDYKCMSNSAQKCNCKPCECIRCTKTIIECCDCEPCQCTECKSLAMHGPRTMIVAPVEEENQRNVCQCSPCGCFECGHAYGATATSRTHEMSTGISRHRNCRCENCINDICNNNEADACSCERHDRVMRKPVQKDNDYGIHRVDIHYNNKPIKTTTQLGIRKAGRYDALAMHSMVTNTFRGPVPKGQISNDCKCSVCECLACQKNIGVSRKLLQSSISSSNKVINISNIIDTCTCYSCECKICSRRKNRNVPNEYGNNCKCEKCDCIDCENIKKSTCKNTEKIIMAPKSVNISCTKIFCKCKPCECMDRQTVMLTCAENICDYCKKCSSDRCEKQINKYRGGEDSKITNPVKEGELLNTYLPLISERYLDYYILGNKQDNSIFSNENKYEYMDCHRNFNNKKKSEKDIFICHSFPKCNAYIENFVNSHAITKPCVTLSPKAEKIPYLGTDKGAIKSYTLKCDACIQCHREDKTRICKETNEQVSGSYISALSSSATIKTSNIIVHNSGSISPIPVRNHMAKSPDQSSCNSSGHDYSDYLIRFPRSTVEVCMSDVMKLNIDKKLNMKLLHVSSKINTEKDCLNSLEHDQKILFKPVEQLLPNMSQKLIQKKTCECMTCFCNKCGLKILKTDRCECKCSACNCFKMCLGGNQQLFIRKNEGSQTKYRFSCDESQDNMDKYRCIRNGEYLTKQIYPLSSTSQKPQVSRDSDKFRNSTNDSDSLTKQCTGKDGKFPCNYGYYALNNMHVCLENNKIPVTNRINYESVQNTLREAKTFSLKLMQILEKYEKANREFKTTSHKLKYSESNNKFLDETKNNIKVNEPTLEKGEKSKIGNNEEIIESVHKIHNTHNEYGNNYTNIDKCESKIMKASKNMNHNTKHLRNESFNYNLNNKIDNYKAQYEQDNRCDETVIRNKSELSKTTHINCDKRNDIKNKYRKYRKLIKRAVIMSRQFHSKIAVADRATTNLNRSVILSSGTLNLQKDKKEIKNKQITFPTSNLKESVDIGKAATETAGHHDLAKVMKQLDLVVGSNGMAKVINLTPLTTSSVNETESILFMKDETNEESLKDVTEKEVLTDDQENLQTENNQEMWPIMKKHFYMNTVVPYKRRNNLVTISPLELDVKKTLESICLQMAITSEFNKQPTLLYKNLALSNLQIEVNKLRDMPILKSHKQDSFGTSCIPINRTQISLSKVKLNLKSKEDSKTQISIPSHQNEDVKIITHKIQHQCIIPKGSATSQVDKIIFEAIQRVSDHTILVKWKVPQDTSNIKGYELLVDGRAVQKILSPNRNMAVLSCLPHIEKVLLTIRIITSTATEPGSYPSTTIVYRPRVK